VFLHEGGPAWQAEDNEEEQVCPTSNEEEQGVSELLEITLHALTGWMRPETMRVVVYANRQPMMVLIDNGSTLNFIHSKVALLLRTFQSLQPWDSL
jgi:hypothetical protein